VWKLPGKQKQKEIQNKEKLIFIIIFMRYSFCGYQQKTNLLQSLIFLITLLENTG